MTTGPENPPPDPTQPYGSAPPPAPPPPPDPGYAGYTQPGLPAGAYGVSSQAPYGLHPVTGIPYSDKSKIIAGLLQILLPFGIGRFYIGDTKIGVIQLIVTVVDLRHRRPVERHRRHHHAGDRQQGRPGLHAQDAELPSGVTKSMSSSTRPSRAGSRSS